MAELGIHAHDSSGLSDASVHVPARGFGYWARSARRATSEVGQHD